MKKKGEKMNRQTAIELGIWTFIIAAVIIAGCTTPVGTIAVVQAKELPCSSIDTCTANYKAAGYSQQYINNIGISCSGGRCYGR